MVQIISAVVTFASPLGKVLCNNLFGGFKLLYLVVWLPALFVGLHDTVMQFMRQSCNGIRLLHANCCKIILLPTVP